MATPGPMPVRLTFGPFEVRGSTGELLKGGTRVHLPAQPFAILLILLKTPGELVTREQLRDQIWPEGTFVDFEHGLNAAMNKLRRALGDSAENPRYIETIPGRGYRFIGMLNSGDVMPISVVARAETREERPRRWRSVGAWERVFWAAGALACLAIGMFFRSEPPSQPEWKLTRITFDQGLSAYPALSPDGKLVVYSSDRGPNSEQDLYVKQVAGGVAVRLTFDGAGNSAPDFSPDGARIVFQSNRNGGGIYEMPALGGEPRLVAAGGLNPKYSPDGSEVAYWLGTEGIHAAVPGSGALWVVPVAGGAPRRIGAQFSAARQPIWLPDSKHVLFVGYMSTRAYDDSGIDWWTASTDRGDTVRTGVYKKLVRDGLQLEGSLANSALDPIPPPGCWSGAANSVVFSTGRGDQKDLWEIGISTRTGKVSGALRRLTTSTLRESYPSCTPGGALAFTSIDTKTDVWSLPFDLDRGTSTGTLQRVTAGPSSREHASLASNLRLVAFASNQSGQMNIWVRSLTTGAESPLASSSLEQHYPVSNATGDKIAFSVFEKNGRAVYVSAPGGPAERVCERCLRATDWSRDDKMILIFGGDPYEIDTLDLASQQRTPILKHPKYNVLYGRFSPDNRWVSFTVRTLPNRARITIAPLNGPGLIPESAWITISEEGPGDSANWSPDGKTVYFSSARDGHTCLWGQRIDALSHHPVGEPFAALHVHGRVHYQPGTRWAGWSVAGGRIAILLAEDTGNVWTMSRLRSR